LESLPFGGVALDCWVIGARQFETVWWFHLQRTKSLAYRLETQGTYRPVVQCLGSEEWKPQLHPC